MHSIIAILTLTSPIWMMVALGAVAERNPSGRTALTLDRIERRMHMPFNG